MAGWLSGWMAGRPQRSRRASLGHLNGVRRRPARSRSRQAARRSRVCPLRASLRDTAAVGPRTTARLPRYRSRRHVTSRAGPQRPSPPPPNPGPRVGGGGVGRRSARLGTCTKSMVVCDTSSSSDPAALPPLPVPSSIAMTASSATRGRRLSPLKSPPAAVGAALSALEAALSSTASQPIHLVPQ